MKIGVISDTHNTFDSCLEEFLRPCDEVWHAGDFGSVEVADSIAALKPLRAVYGNIDGGVLRRMYNDINLFEVEGVKVLMTHIGGYPNAYAPGIKQMLLEEKPDIFISGHSHILKVMRDQQLGLLHLNPGAAGLKGFHKKVTMLRFQIDGKEISKMEIYEADRY